MLLAFLSAAWAWPYTPWVGGTGSRTVGLNPYVIVDQDGVGTLNPYVLVGLHDRFDVIAGYAIDLVPDGPSLAAESGPIEVLPRLVVSDAFVVAPHLWATPGGSTEIGLEVHGNWLGDRWMFTHNTGASTAVGSPSRALYTMLAPEVRTGRVWWFVEVNPTLYLEGGRATADVTVVPGLTLSIDPEEYHLVTVGVPTTFGADAPYTALGVAYWGTFELGAR